MSTKMTDLPADIASMITNNLKHDPVYLIKYKHIETSFNEHACVNEIDEEDYVKLVTLVGGPDDCEDIFNDEGGLYDREGIFSKIKNSPYLLAYVKVCSSMANTTKKLADLLKPWTVIKTKDSEEMIIIQEFTRYA